MNQRPNMNDGTTNRQPDEVTLNEDEELKRLRRAPEGIERLELHATRERDLQILCDRVLAVLDGAPGPITFYEICRTDAKPPWREAVMRLIETGVIQASAEKPQRFRRVKP